MHQEALQIVVSLPSVAEFGDRFPQYGPRADGDGRDLYELVMRCEVFNAASVLTTVLGLPAVTAVAQPALDRRGELAGTDRQFLGALMCALMEANGFAKTGHKRAVPHPVWKRGEVYARGPVDGSG